MATGFLSSYPYSKLHLLQNCTAFMISILHNHANTSTFGKINLRDQSGEYRLPAFHFGTSLLPLLGPWQIDGYR